MMVRLDGQMMSDAGCRTDAGWMQDIPTHWNMVSCARLGHIKLTDMGLAKVSVGKCLGRK